MRASMDRPKLLGSVDAVDVRLAQLGQPHIFQLTEFVRKLRSAMGPEAAIPFFDPWDGGVEAVVLFLLEAPGRKARNSGFISRNNPDETAKNLYELSEIAGIDRKQTIIWNTVPWYIGSGVRIRPANTTDISLGIESLAELLKILPKLRAVVLVGGKAQKAESHVAKITPQLSIFSSPHPSPMFVNRKPENRNLLLAKWYAVKDFLERK